MDMQNLLEIIKKILKRFFLLFIPQITSSCIPVNLLENLPGFVYWKNTASEYIGCNSNFARLLGLNNPTEIKKINDSDFPWATQLRADDLAFIHGGNTQITEQTLSIENSGIINLYIRVQRSLLQDKNNKSAGLIVVINDITQQKNIEKALIEEKNKIEKSEQMKDDILYNLPGLIYWKNIELQYVAFNKNVVTLSGLDRDELYGKTDKELGWGSLGAEEFQRDDKEIMETGVIKVTEDEIPIKRPDGRFLILKTEKSKLCTRAGKLAGVLGVALDITDQKILEEKLQEEKSRVEKLSEAQREFIRHMEHDIRTPFTGIYTMAMALSNKEDDPKKKEYLKMITSAAKELLDYCNGILDFSRIESNTFAILEKKFSMKELIFRVLQMELPAADAKKLDLQYELDPRIPSILIGDGFRIQRILLNLISNAIKFTENGYVKVYADLLKTNEKNVILKISVKDTGIGIPEDKREYIFEKFTRISPANRGFYKGSGLGLNVVKQLISDIGGEVDVESQLEVGSCFMITFPLVLPLNGDSLENGGITHGH